MMRLIFNGILLLASAAIVFVYVKPVYEAPDTGIVALQGKIEVLKKARADLDELKQKQGDFLAKRSEISQEELERLERLLPREINPVLFVMELDTIAKEQGMSLKNIKFAETKKDTPAPSGGAAATAKKPYETFTLSFDVTGPYANFTTFLQQIEQGLRVTDVTSITLVANDKVDVYQYAVKAQTYWLK
jgi:Tfp pilus assembly protein PilO